ncbi:hypothetical protein [Natrinema hispanicum]|uniref:Uncharacterized protein n=1 Tax=Natrinema hispanicum TaxID=392421 RepID=A0A1G6SN87_9EURY|nr:hypothetical protein [Natrinema hispanicum]SDD17697.1 hypothetical protein SAMN05192552_101470 [Natrinema hispanicum]
MADDKSHVGLRIPTYQKERWEQAQKASDHDSMSSWLKYVVESHLAGNNTPQTGVNDEGVDQILDKLAGLSNDMSNLEQTVNEVSEEQSGAGYDFDRVLLELLPTVPDSATAPAGEDGTEETVTQPDEGGPHPEEWAVTPNGLAARIGGDKEAVSDRLRHLSKTVTEVGLIEYDGTVHYYKESDY